MKKNKEMINILIQNLQEMRDNDANIDIDYKTDLVKVAQQLNGTEYYKRHIEIQIEGGWFIKDANGIHRS